jgi:hypothetical protein
MTETLDAVGRGQIKRDCLNSKLTMKSGCHSLYSAQDATMHNYILQYRFNAEPRTYSLKLHQPVLSAHEAAMHLLQLHLGDGENSLMMPNADASSSEILEQARLVGLTEIEVATDAGDG